MPWPPRIHKARKYLSPHPFPPARNPSNYRAYASRALAYEGLARWDMAVEDYSKALRLGQEATGGGPEPYVMNSRGNAYASRGLYSEALHDYDESVKV